MTQATPSPHAHADVVRAVVDEHRDEPGNLLVVLLDLQERLGHLDPALVPLVARELNLSRAEVHGVLSFYRDLRTTPPATVRVRLCRAEACASVGAEALVRDVGERLGADLGGTTPDGEVSLEEVFCLGNCALGPSGQVDGRVHGRLDADRVLDLVARARP